MGPARESRAKIRRRPAQQIRRKDRESRGGGGAGGSCKEKEAGGYYKSKKIHEDALEKRQVGLIAQEVQAVLPELVSEDGEGYLSVNYANLVAVLVEANKEQQKLIEAYKN